MPKKGYVTSVFLTLYRENSDLPHLYEVKVLFIYYPFFFFFLFLLDRISIRKLKKKDNKVQITTAHSRNTEAATS